MVVVRKKGSESKTLVHIVLNYDYSVYNIIFFSLLDSDWLKSVPINP